MTTIAYDHKNGFIAADSRMTKSSGRYNDCFDKIIRKDDLIFALTGSTCDVDFFVNSYCKYSNTGLGDVDIDCAGIMVRDKKAYYVFIEDGVFNEDTLICNEAYGSGAAFALAAMDFGRGVKEAVEYASTRDIYTGGKVKVFSIEDGEFI